MENKEELNEVIILLSELENDITISQTTKEKIMRSIEMLNGDIDLSVRVSKVLHEIEEASQNSNIESYTRTRLWNVVSLLEKL